MALYDAAAAPFSGASRWNEGKIHLGFLYAADPSLRTAQRVLPGGLAFRPLMEELLGCPLRNITESEDTVLLHRDSVVSAAGMRTYFESLTALIRSHPAAGDYLVDISDARVTELSEREVGQIADPAFVSAGFVVPERSLSTRWVADRFIDSLAAEKGIESQMATRVLGVDARDGGMQGPFWVKTDVGTDGPYDVVVNALWEGRPRIDASLGIQQDHELSHRYRLALFIETRQRVETPSAVLCTGAFGDVKNYNGRELYVSWYPTGLLASGEAIDPPLLPQLDASERKALTDDIFSQLGRIIPSVSRIEEDATEIRLEGGWVFARGRGDLNDPESTLHQRDRIGIKRLGSYFSIDTGKYSVAPWLALQVAEAIVD